MLTQQQIEDNMYSSGVDRARAMFTNAEEGGRAADAPYAQRLYREFVLPLANQIKADLAVDVGRKIAHAKLLAPLDPEAVAVLSVRRTLNFLFQHPEANHRQLAFKIGHAINGELVLSQIEHENPELYWTLQNDLDRRLSEDERHRITVMQMQAKKAGVEFQRWQIGNRDQVGMYLLEKLSNLGMIELGTLRKTTRGGEYRTVALTDQVLATINPLKGYMEVTMPVYGPCVEQPIDWPGLTGGGFHTDRMRRICARLVVAAPTARPMLRQHEMPIVLAAVNALQRTSWKVNQEVYDVVMNAAKAGIRLKEAPSPTHDPKPERADFMEHEKDTWTPEQHEHFKLWKREVRDWHESRKVHRERYGRFYTTTRQAAMLLEQPELFFVYFADSRGRLYPMTYGLNPQGSDLQKALLQFSVGMPVHTDDAKKWFYVQGANKYGYDKDTLAGRVAWVKERHDWIMAFAKAPLDNRDWTLAADPLQFLAWCFEYRAFHTDPGFMSHLPISMDGSCNGLQNFSAMLRDEIGGKATNLTNNVEGCDIYRMVADAAFKRMLDAPDDPEGFRQRWIAHGINRSIVKRAVMTTPYGVTRSSATDYVVKDYLQTGAFPELSREEYKAAAIYLMQFAWPAIGDVVVKSREAMDWLKKASKKIMKAKAGIGDPDPVIHWTTPSGFLATQGYFEYRVHRIHTKLHGDVKIRVTSETDTPDASRHANGIAPNFVHSMDASHLHLVSAAAAGAGIHSLAMIHDDYGTHAANAQKLYHLIREQFHKMYTEHDPVEDFYRQYPEAGPPPAKGALDLDEVLSSEFFFS
jgi:DNA-directed RNA polymerase